LIGESLGGLLATEILEKKPALFTNYIIISPSLWWDDASLLKDTISDNFTQKTSIYIGVGKEGLGPAKKPHNMVTEAAALSEKLKNTKSKSVNIVFDYLPDESHATISEQALYNAFKNLFAPASGN